MATSYHPATLMTRLVPKLPLASTYSGYSIFAALSSLFQATSGKSREQLGQFLGLTPDQDYWEMMTQARQKLSYTGEMKSSDFLVSVDAFPIREDFRKSSAACLELLSEKDPMFLRTAVNEKVKEVTQGLIPELLQPSDITADTQLVLVNALYFLSRWQYPFDPKRTSKQDFTTLEGETRSVDLMFQRRKVGFRYYEDEHLQYLEMPYSLPSDDSDDSEAESKASDYVMGIVLPREISRTGELSRPELMAELMARATPQDVNLYLPKFTQKTRLSLKEILGQLGLGELMACCELGHLTDAPPLAVSDVIHEAVLKVDEFKTEGAAATAVVMIKMAMMQRPPPKQFRADHPFFYQVVHRDSQVPILSGVFNGSS